jgi:uncharacterized small protein (DUF1192 family)
MPRRRRWYEEERVEEIGGHKFITLQSGRRITFLDAQSMADAARTALSTAASRMFKLARHQDRDIDEWNLELIDSFVENLEDYVGILRTEIDKLIGVKSKEERIALLRNVSGRTPEEAAEFRRKADELEKRLQEGR